MSQIVGIHSMQGLGDNIYQRAFVKEIAKNFQTVYINTPWVQLYSDIPNILFVERNTPLRTQRKNISKIPKERWATNIPQCPMIHIAYTQTEGILNGMSRSSGIPIPSEFDIPERYSKEQPIIEGEYIVVRPVTIRKESNFISRNPDPKYLTEAVINIKHHRPGIKVVSVADVFPPMEEYVGNPPPCDIRYDNGELNFDQLMNVCVHAKGIIGSVGWIVALSEAIDVPTCCILGGYGGCNSPDKISPPQAKIHYIPPDNFCMCTNMQHTRCDKNINNFRKHFDSWLYNNNIIK
jgi:hypothetical protein